MESLYSSFSFHFTGFDILHSAFYLSGNSKVEYLLHRLDGLSKEEIDALRNQTPQK